MFKLLGVCFICVLCVLFGMSGGGNVVVRDSPKTPRPKIRPKGQGLDKE
jgi:hypothetical protein